MAALSTTIHLVRHGEVHNPNRVLYGRLSGFRLSRQGMEQARAAADFLRENAIGAIYAGPLLRTRKTGEAIAAHHNPVRLRLSSLLNEVCTPYEGLPGSLIDARKGDIYTYEGDGGCFEQPRDVLSRLRKFVNRVQKQHCGSEVVAVTHGDVIVFTALWALGCEVSPANKKQLRHAGFPAAYPAHASITTLSFGDPEADERPDINYSVPY